MSRRSRLKALSSPVSFSLQNQNISSSPPDETAEISNGQNQSESVEQCLQQVEICCEQARDAARRRRFEAAIGLFSTAVALCRRALSSAKISETGRRALKENLDRISSEMAAYTQLVSSLHRPLHTPLAVSNRAVSRLHKPTSSTRNDENSPQKTPRNKKTELL